MDFHQSMADALVKWLAWMTLEKFTKDFAFLNTLRISNLGVKFWITTTLKALSYGPT